MEKKIATFSKPTVWIMQGISGAGKSTAVPANAHVVSADHLFIDPHTQQYNFDPSKLPLAHGQCLRYFVIALQNEVPFIVVDNTNTTIAEVAPYYALANAYGYDAVIVHIDTAPLVAAERNVHGVPLTGIEAQYKRLLQFSEQMPPWWQRVTKV